MKVQKVPVSSTIAPSVGEVIAFPEDHVSLLDAYLRGLPSVGTRRVYGRIVRAFRGWLARDPESATRREIESYREHLEQLGRAPSTVALHLSAVAGYLQFAADEGVLDTSPAARVRRPRVHEPPPRQGLTPAEVSAMLDVCHETTLIGLRDRALVLVLAIQGLRVSEALALRVGDFAEEGGHRVASILGKGAKPARIPITPKVWTAIRRWLDAAPVAEGPVFVAVLRGDRVQRAKAISPQAAWKRVVYLADLAGLRHVHPHLFRHGAATQALLANVPLHRVQAHLRHADPRTTQRYNSQRDALDNPTGPVLAALIGMET
jgi:integrase